MRIVAFLALVLAMLVSCGGDPEIVNNTSADFDVVENLTATEDMVDSNAEDPASADDAAVSNGRRYCDVIADVVSAEDCDYFREIRSRLEAGSAALSAPSRMTRGVAEQVEFAIARPSSPDRPAEAADAADLLADDPTLTDTIRVGRRMAVLLEGEGFTITPEGMREADLGITGAARWQWTVTPSQSGQRRLVLTAYVVVQAPDGTRGQHLINTMNQPVEVTVAASDRADGLFEAVVKWLGNIKNLLGALAAVLLAAVGLRAAWRKLRSDGAGTGERLPGHAGGGDAGAAGGAAEDGDAGDG